MCKCLVVLAGTALSSITFLSKLDIEPARQELHLLAVSAALAAEADENGRSRTVDQERNIYDSRLLNRGS